MKSGDGDDYDGDDDWWRPNAILPCNINIALTLSGDITSDFDLICSTKPTHDAPT